MQKFEYRLKFVNTYFTNKNDEKPKVFQIPSDLVDYQCDNEWHVLPLPKYHTPSLFFDGSYLASQLNVVLMKLRESFALCLEVREDDKKHIFAISGCGVVEITNF